MTKIKKGDIFWCTEEVVMNVSGKVAYTKGKIYHSELDGCITDDQGFKGHSWTNIEPYFKRPRK